MLPSFFDVTVTEPADTQADAETLLRDNKVDVAFVTGKTPVLALVDGSNLFAAQSAVAALNKAGDRVKTQVLYNPGLKTSWVMVPAIIGLILTFIGTIVTSIGMVREREAGTLEQLAVMPIRPSRVILGKIAPYFLVAAAGHDHRDRAGDRALLGPVQRQSVRVRAGRRDLPVRGARPRRVHLHDLADRRPGDPDRVLLPSPADPALRDDLPAGRDGRRGPLDRLPAAAHLLHHDLAGDHAARRPDRLAVAAVRRARRDGGRGVHRRHAAFPPGPRAGPEPDPDQGSGPAHAQPAATEPAAAGGKASPAGTA